MRENNESSIFVVQYTGFLYTVEHSSHNLCFRIKSLESGDSLSGECTEKGLQHPGDTPVCASEVARVKALAMEFSLSINSCLSSHLEKAFTEKFRSTSTRSTSMP